jgi:hypothetical protein
MDSGGSRGIHAPEYCHARTEALALGSSLMLHRCASHSKRPRRSLAFFRILFNPIKESNRTRPSGPGFPSPLRHREQLQRDAQPRAQVSSLLNRPSTTEQCKFSEDLCHMSTSQDESGADDGFGDLPLVAMVVAGQLVTVTCPTSQWYIENGQ